MWPKEMLNKSTEKIIKTKEGGGGQFKVKRERELELSNGCGVNRKRASVEV